MRSLKRRRTAGAWTSNTKDVVLALAVDGWKLEGTPSNFRFQSPATRSDFITEMETGLASPTRMVPLSQVMLAGMLCMSLLGAATVYYGPTLIYVAEESRQSLATVGAVLAIHGVGFFFSTLTANRLARRFEMRRGTIMGCGLVAAGILGYMLLPFPVNILSAFLVGFGAGTLEVLLNRLVELLAGDEPGAALTRLHSTWGVGAVAIPLVVAVVVQLGLNWRFAGVLLLIYLAMCVAVILRWPEFKVDHGPEVNWRTVPWRSVLIFIAMFFVYTGVETAVGGWATTFFAKLGEGVLLGALATSFFFLMLTIGRLLFGSRVDRLGFAAPAWSADFQTRHMDREGRHVLPAL